jgi:hypothetical protein
VPIDYQKLMQWPFPAVQRHYSVQETGRVAVGFGAGLPGSLRAGDAPFIKGESALPMLALALADGEFWQMDPDAGIDWRRIVHAEECLTMHGALAPSGTVVVTQRIGGIFDRGLDKGAVMQQQQFLHTEDGTPLATIDVTTLLRGDGGFGGQPYNPTKLAIPEQRAPDVTLEIATPLDDEHAIFRLSKELAVAAGSGKAMMRGLGCFGLAGRGVLKLVCGNQPERLKRLGVRYVGPMFTDEVMLIELWHVGAGQAVFSMSARERSTLVLNNCYVEFDDGAAPE